MLLEGSCHCGAVRFSVESPHPYPFNLCYCSICRKTAGGGGYAINLSGRFETLQVRGQGSLQIYQARLTNPKNGEVEESPGRRHFCSICGSALWLWDPRWPELVHPFASAIDCELPAPPERNHLMLRYRASWVPLQADPQDRQFQEYPDESIAQWHKRLRLER
jgi:hypothetical protein